jgi:hypothetical protein
MKTLSIIKAAFAASLAALLAACGDGGDSAAPPADLPPVAWASPAVFVTPGASNKTFALEGCSGRLGGEDMDSYGGNFYNASLNIASNGNVSFSAATTTTGTVSVLWTMAFEDVGNVS